MVRARFASAPCRVACGAVALACSASSPDGEMPEVRQSASAAAPGGARPGDDLQAVLFDVEGEFVSIDVGDCASAAASKSYVGCDYWPVPLGNAVERIYDFATVVANVGPRPADVVVTGQGVTATVTVAPTELAAIYLPWVEGLQAAEPYSRGGVVPLLWTRRARPGAYHLESSEPVVVYQFNPLQYRGEGGREGKNWSGCRIASLADTSCYSFSNDASLLFPSTALTSTYRITAPHPGGPVDAPGTYVAIAGVEDGTDVTLQVSGTAELVPGGGMDLDEVTGDARFSLDRGEVLQILTRDDSDFDVSGSLVTATRPVQVMTGHQCAENPVGVPACDHLEESVLPVETWGKHHVVARPTGPLGEAVNHTVRLYGNVDGTELAFDPALPDVPRRVDAGQVLDLGMVGVDFEVTGTEAFSVATFQIGGEIVGDAGDYNVPAFGRPGDPSQSVVIAVEQYRSNYVFLAPNDYSSNFVDVVRPVGTPVRLNGGELSGDPSPVGESGYEVVRTELPNLGRHVLEADAPVGIQVIGYGTYTSYQYPGGLDLESIAPPPASIR